MRDGPAVVLLAEMQHTAVVLVVQALRQQKASCNSTEQVFSLLRLRKASAVMDFESVCNTFIKLKELFRQDFV